MAGASWSDLGAEQSWASGEQGGLAAAVLSPPLFPLVLFSALPPVCPSPTAPKVGGLANTPGQAACVG